MRIRPVNAGSPADFCTTFDVSSTGIYFGTSASHYDIGKKFYVARDFVVADPNREEIIGAVVRIDKREDGSSGVAIHFSDSKGRSWPLKCFASYLTPGEPLIP